MSGAAYASPFAGSPALGRTDQGVDVALSPGKPIFAIGNAKITGIQQNWYSGQPFLWYQLLDGPQQGRYVYVAEQITPTVKVGQTVGAAEQIGTYAPTGTALETGWATAGGQTLARATTGYTEGQATPAGSSFRSFLSNLTANGADPSQARYAHPNLPSDNLGNGGPVPFLGLDSGTSPKDVATAAITSVLGGIWDGAKGGALRALLYVVFTLGGMVLAVYGLSRMLGPDNPIAQAAGGLRRGAEVAAVA